MPQVASEAHVASHASARSSQRNRSANGHGETPSTPFASLIDRAPTDADGAADRAGPPADAVRQPETARNTDRSTDRGHGKRHETGDRTEASRNDKPARHHGKTKKADDKTDAAEAGKDSSAQETDAAAKDDGAVTDSDETKDTKSDGDGDAVLADTLQIPVDPSQADAAKAAQTEATAAPVVTAQPTTDSTAAGSADTDLAIDGDKPATSPLLAATLKAAVEDGTKADAKDAKTDGQTDAKIDTSNTADTDGTSDDSALRDALKAQHAGETRDGKPAAAAAKSADGDTKAAEQKPHQAAGAGPAADAQPANTTHSHGAQGGQNQTQVPQVQHAAQTAATHAADASPVSQQAPAVPVEGVAVQVAAQAKAGKNRFEIRLDPPELGRIDVRLDVDRHGHVTSRLVVDRPETLDLLRRDASGLERALQDAGLKTSDNGLQFSLRDQSMQQQAFRQSQDTAEVIVKDDALPPVETMQRGYRPLAGSRGGVDIRV